MKHLKRESVVAHTNIKFFLYPTGLSFYFQYLFCFTSFSLGKVSFLKVSEVYCYRFNNNIFIPALVSALQLWCCQITYYNLTQTSFSLCLIINTAMK